MQETAMIEKVYQCDLFEKETGKHVFEEHLQEGGEGYSDSYVEWLESKAEAYDRIMSGGLSMKELANILGKPVAIDAENRLWWFPKNPEIGMTTWFWYDNQFGCFGEELPRNIITFSVDWKDSLTLPDNWEETT